MKNMRDLKKRLFTIGVCLGIFTSSGVVVHAQTSQADAIAQLQKQNEALQKRLDALETTVSNEGIAADPKQITTPTVTAANAMIISGYVQTSYFDNLENPSGGSNAGYLWNTKNNNFSINKVKFTVASPPVVRSGDNWDAGYRLSLIAGQDAPILNSNSSTTGFDYLREAYVDINVPIGNGLNIKAGDMISLLNYESGDGGAANVNFSQGYQWYYTGDGPETGVQLDYDFTNWFNVKFRIEDGLYDGAISSRNEKGFMGSLNFKPTSKFWFNLLGFGGLGVGDEDADGGEILAGYQVTKQLGTAFEGDYFHLDATTGQSGELWSIGGWAWYDFTPKLGLAFRAEFLDDPDGVGLNVSDPNSLAPAPNGAGISSTDNSGDLASFTLTLNLKPTPNIKIQPEIRYDATSYAGGFNGKAQQIIVGCGISYLY
jgi:hypothetical protein